MKGKFPWQVLPVDQLVSLIAKTTFKPFSETDWYAFAGCESKEPLIAETDTHTIVVDGAYVAMIRHGEAVHQEAADEYLLMLR